MPHFNRNINVLKGTFNDHFLELRYRQGSFRNDLDVNRLAFFLFLIYSVYTLVFIAQYLSYLGHHPSLIIFSKVRNLIVYTLIGKYD